MKLKACLLMHLVVGVLCAAQAQNANEPSVEYWVNGSIDGPRELEASFVWLTVHNQGAVPVELDIYRLRNDVSVDDLRANFARFDTLGQADPSDIPQILASIVEELAVLTESFGGISADPGEAAQVGVSLVPGSYVLSFLGEALTLETVEVSANDVETSAPDADVMIPMVDFAFMFPAGIAAGSQTWEVANQGEQLHHLMLFKLLPGKTLEDAHSFMMTFDGDMPMESVAYIHTLSPSQSNYVTLDLEPGTYVALCQVPDHMNNTGLSHMELGMLQSFEVRR